MIPGPPSTGADAPTTPVPPPPNRPPATKDAAARRELERAKAIVARWTID